MSKSDEKRALPIRYEHVKVFLASYGRAAKIAQLLYRYDTPYILEIVSREEKRWQRYKKVVKIVKFAADFLVPGEYIYDTATHRSKWLTYINDALLKMASRASCPRWREIYRYMPAPTDPLKVEHYKKNYPGPYK